MAARKQTQKQRGAQKRKQTIEARQKKQKATLIEEIQKVPTLEIAAKRAGVDRSTVYRWCESDKEFNKQFRQAHYEGIHRTNDVAESKVIEGIYKDDKFYTSMWLKNRHPAYRQRKVVETEKSTAPSPEKKQQIQETIGRWSRKGKYSQKKRKKKGS